MLELLDDVVSGHRPASALSAALQSRGPRGPSTGASGGRQGWAAVTFDIVEVCVLGPVGTRVAGVARVVPGRAVPAILAMLALAEGDEVRSDALIEGLWGRSVPAEPSAALHVTISRLRRSLGEHRDVIESRPSAYRLDTDRVVVDLSTVRDGQRRGLGLLERREYAAAAAELSAALGQWRGPPLIDLVDLPFVAEVQSELHRLRLDIVEARNDALLESGRTAEVIVDTDGFLETDPWRERLVGQLMLALYRCGRHADALATYSRHVSALRRDFGAEPGPNLQTLHVAILRHDDELQLGASPPVRTSGRSLPEWFRAALRPEDEPDDRLRYRLLLALGEAQHHAGEHGWRETLREAGVLARDLGDRESIARVACAGAMGWDTTAGRGDSGRLELIDAALDPPHGLSPAWQARLLAAKAVEFGFSADLDERRTISDHALRLAHESGEPGIVLSVLSQRFSAVWAPETRESRRDEARDAVRLATHDGRSSARAVASGFRMAVGIEDGDIDVVDRELGRLRSLAIESQESALLWGCAVHEGWRAVVAGQMELAEDRCDDALAIGTRDGRPEAGVVARMQRISIRWASADLGTQVEALELLSESLPTLGMVDALLALARHMSADDQGARCGLRAAARDHFDDVHRDQAWLVTMVLWAELAAHLDDRAAAVDLTRHLHPFADHVAFNGTGVFGPVSHALGILASTNGDADEAQHQFDDALARARRMRSPLFAERTRRAAGDPAA